MRNHWDQIGQHATCIIKYKCKNMPYQQTQHNDLIGFQIPLQFDLRNLV
jgi:hypothetical protein